MVRPPMHLLLSVSAEIRGRDARVSLFIPFPTPHGGSLADVSVWVRAVRHPTDQEPDRVSFGKAVQSVAWRASRRRAKGQSK
jgi:hypothetical protein